MPDLQAYEAKREALRQQFMPEGVPAAETVWTGGVHHLALICSDVEATIRFYTEVTHLPAARP